jgi:hypothetical protein
MKSIHRRTAFPIFAALGHLELTLAVTALIRHFSTGLRLWWWVLTFPVNQFHFAPARSASEWQSFWDVPVCPDDGTWYCGEVLCAVNSILWGCMLTWLLRKTEARSDEIDDDQSPPNNRQALFIGLLAFGHLLVTLALLATHHRIPEFARHYILTPIWWVLAFPLSLVTLASHGIREPSDLSWSNCEVFFAFQYANSVIWGFGLAWLLRRYAPKSFSRASLTVTMRSLPRRSSFPVLLSLAHLEMTYLLLDVTSHLKGAGHRLGSTLLWLVGFPCSLAFYLLTGNEGGSDDQIFAWEMICGFLAIPNSILWGCALTWLIRRRVRLEDLPNTVPKPSNGFAALIGCFALFHFVALIGLGHIDYWLPELSRSAIDSVRAFLALPGTIIVALWHCLFSDQFIFSQCAGTLVANSLLWGYALAWLVRWLWRATRGKLLS